METAPGQWVHGSYLAPASSPQQSNGGHATGPGLQHAKESDSSDSAESIEDAYRQALSRYGHRENVTGVDIGREYKNGQETGRLAVRLHVREKLPETALEAAEAFPETLDGFPIDVIQANYEPGEDRAVAPETRDRMLRFSTLQPGISVGHTSVGAGTLGLIVMDNVTRKPAILSNWHVLAGSSSARPGDDIVQPGTGDGGQSPRDTVAKLARTLLNRDGDAAIALLTGSRPFSSTVLGVGAQVHGIAEPRIGDLVVKSGRSTGVTRGRVDGIGRYYIRYSTGQVGIDGCTIVPRTDGNPNNEEISTSGDSGASWLLEGSQTMVGLHFAGETDALPSREHAIACFPTRVFSQLNISLPAQTQEAAGFGGAEEHELKWAAVLPGESVASSLLQCFKRSDLIRLGEHLARTRPELNNIPGGGIEAGTTSENAALALALGFCAGAARQITLPQGAAEEVGAENLASAAAAFMAGMFAGIGERLGEANGDCSKHLVSQFSEGAFS